MVGTWEGVARWEPGRGHGLDSVSTTLPTLLQYMYLTYLYLSTYMYVYVSFRESGTKSKAASLPQGPMQSAYMICPSNTTLFAEGSRAAADDIPAGSIGSLAGHTA